VPSFRDAFYTAISAFFRNLPRPVVVTRLLFMYLPCAMVLAIFPRLATDSKSLKLLEIYDDVLPAYIGV